MHHDLTVLADTDAVAHAAAEFVAATARAAVVHRSEFSFAVSGGRTPWAMLTRLSGADMPWDRTVIYQVDERVAPIDDPDRNLRHLRQSIGEVGAVVEAMPVERDDLDAASADYARRLPSRFDLIHLGLGSDGHTASLLPGDTVLDVTDRLVASTSSLYQGRRRMTLTYRALSRGRQLLWLVTGSNKRAALGRLLGGDSDMPAGRVTADASLVMADPGAAGAAW